MPVVFLIAIVAVLVGIFFAATGRGGELAYEQTDHAPVDLGPVSAADIALLRPPTAMWGYNMQVTDEALDNIARAMRGRDVTIAFLQEQLATLARNGSYAEPRGAYARQDLAPGIPSFPEASERPEAADIVEAPETLESPQPRWAADIVEAPETLESPQPRWAADIAEAREALESPQAPLTSRRLPRSWSLLRLTGTLTSRRLPRPQIFPWSPVRRRLPGLPSPL